MHPMAIRSRCEFLGLVLPVKAGRSLERRAKIGDHEAELVVGGERRIDTNPRRIAEALIVCNAHRVWPAFPSRTNKCELVDSARASCLSCSGGALF